MRQMDIVSPTYFVTHTDQSIFLGSHFKFCDTQMMAVFPQESSTEASWGFFG